MSDLDRWLGRGPLTATPAKDNYSDGKEGPNSEEPTNSDIRQTNSDNVEVTSSDPDSAWLKMAVSDPTAWRKRGNPYTDRIAQMIADDAMLPRDGEVGRDVWRLAAKLIGEIGSPNMVEDAIQECRRTQANWRELSIWVAGKQIMHTAARAKAKSYFVSHLNDDPVTEEDNLIPCKKCGKMVYSEREQDDCKGH